MTAAVLSRPATTPASGCHFRWCVGRMCSPDSHDNLHKGRPSAIQSFPHDYDVSVFPTAFDFDDNTSSDQVVEFTIDSTDTGEGVWVNCSPADAYALSAALVAASSGKLARGCAVTIQTTPGPYVADGTITVELLDESHDVVIPLASRDSLNPLVEVTVTGDGDSGMEHQACRLFASHACDLGRFVQLAAFEVLR